MDLYVLELTKEDPVDHAYVKKNGEGKGDCTVPVMMYRISHFLSFDEIVVIIEFALKR